MIFQVVAYSVIILFCLFILFIVFLKKPKTPEWKKKSQKKFKEISNSQFENNLSLQINTLIKLDKLLHYVLKYRVSRGDTLAHKLKLASDLWDRDLYDKIWQAHKYRNEIVHNIDFKASSKILLFNIDNLRKAIKQIIY